mmetsp:Transcript_29327/g.94026  ORF Transcript_29327/g.94026 Transcript_29327/m.94026 type:complete len:640 (+) Transcript_29327:1778-3697(+)
MVVVVVGIVVMRIFWALWNACAWPAGLDVQGPQPAYSVYAFLVLAHAIHLPDSQRRKPVRLGRQLELIHGAAQDHLTASLARDGLENPVHVVWQVGRDAVLLRLHRVNFLAAVVVHDVIGNGLRARPTAGLRLGARHLRRGRLRTHDPRRARLHPHHGVQILGHPVLHVSRNLRGIRRRHERDDGHERQGRVHVRQQQPKPRDGPAEQDVRPPHHDVAPPKRIREEHRHRNEPKPHRLHRMLRIGIEHRNDHQTNAVVHHRQQEEEVDGGVPQTEHHGRNHPRQGDVCCGRYAPAGDEHFEGNVLAPFARSTQHAVVTVITVRIVGFIARVVVEATHEIEEPHGDDVREHRSNDASDRCQQGAERPLNRVQGPPRQHRLRHFLGREAEEEHHEDVVRQEVDGDVVPEDGVVGDEDELVAMVVRPHEVLVVLGRRVREDQRRDDTDQQRQRVLLQHRHEAGDGVLRELRRVRQLLSPARPLLELLVCLLSLHHEQHPARHAAPELLRARRCPAKVVVRLRPRHQADMPHELLHPVKHLRRVLGLFADVEHLVAAENRPHGAAHVERGLLVVLRAHDHVEPLHWGRARLRRQRRREAHQHLRLLPDQESRRVKAQDLHAFSRPDGLRLQEELGLVVKNLLA